LRKPRLANARHARSIAANSVLQLKRLNLKLLAAWSFRDSRFDFAVTVLERKVRD